MYSRSRVGYSFDPYGGCLATVGGLVDYNLGFHTHRSFSIIPAFMILRLISCGVLATVLPICHLLAAESAPQTRVAEDVAAGHSYHGEAFNEGPRQAAVLIPGMAETRFPTSTKSDEAQKFMEQGIAQLHGFWYLEAERSFRQAAKLDPKLAIAYWGMAMANANNQERARGLIDEAMKLRNQKGTSKREKQYIEALERFLPKKKAEDAETAEPSKEAKDAAREAKIKRAERYIADLEKIIHDDPDDIEAKAFIVVHMWQADRYGLKLTSRYAVNALMGEILDANPLHPVHHYRIHLWDSARPENAIESAAKCGPASPGIAHMWHMPGHIYSKLKRYSDAAWQQEASARVDHAHMNRARLMPDQIHNFAHNNEWLTRNLLYIGRVQEALDQSRNLVSLPRHPAYNSLKKRGSYKFGRQRLLQTLSQYALWEELIQESGGHYLPPTKDSGEQEEWLGWLSVARFMTGDKARGGKTLRSLQRRRIALQEQLLDLADRQAVVGGETPDRDADESEDSSDDDDESESEPTRDELKKHIAQLRQVIARAASASAAVRKDKPALERQMKAAKLDTVIQAQWLAMAGDVAGGIKLAEKAVKEGVSQVRPLAVLVDLLWQKGDKDAAIKRFGDLRKLAADADIDTPILAKLKPIAKAAKVDGDWRIKRKPADDLGQRPPLDDLGPFRWQPYTAPSWEAIAADEEPESNDRFRGRPRLVIFYLGFGCLHCVEQLHEFAPHLDDFRKAGIDVVAISTEEVKQLQAGIEDFDEPLAIPLLADPSHAAFKAFRCWDDFEDQPLHGTFLIDAQDRVRWQDISHEPFTEAEFLLEESQRLLALP
ncbi:MAG: redoxin domain-containing protein [Pirellulaceae bacterium]|nr:redoxin domain-containing protein [Pirellulaceae bacterium]